MTTTVSEGGEDLADILDKMDPKKRESLINSALTEFGNNPFDKASTNVIVKNAGISKGLLYHYFDNKEALYDYLIDFYFTKSIGELGDKFNDDEPDLLKRIEDMVRAKVQYLESFPAIVNFAKVFYHNYSIDDAKDIMEKYIPKRYMDFYTRNVDYTLFREGVDIQKAINTVQWTLEKISENFATALVNNLPVTVEDAFKEVEDYIVHFRDTYYK